MSVVPLEERRDVIESSVSSQAHSIQKRPNRRLISSELMPSLTMVVIRDGATRRMRRDHERNVDCTCVAQFPVPGLE